MSELSAKELTIAQMRASGAAIKEIAEETGLTASRVAHIVSPESKQRNERVLAAIQEFKTAMAEGFRSVGTMIVDRAKKEIGEGEAIDAYRFSALLTQFAQQNGEEEAAGKGIKIGTMVQALFRS